VRTHGVVGKLRQQGDAPRGRDQVLEGTLLGAHRMDELGTGDGDRLRHPPGELQRDGGETGLLVDGLDHARGRGQHLRGSDRAGHRERPRSQDELQSRPRDPALTFEGRHHA